MDKLDSLWNYCFEQRESGRHATTVGITVSNFVVTIAGVLFAYMVSEKFAQSTIPIAIFMFFLGAYGVLAILKTHERTEMFYTRSRKCIEKIDDILGEKLIGKIISDASDLHKKQHSIPEKFKLRHVLISLHLFIVTLSVFCIIYSLAK